MLLDRLQPSERSRRRFPIRAYRVFVADPPWPYEKRQEDPSHAPFRRCRDSAAGKANQFLSAKVGAATGSATEPVALS
jgi:hypothetical protein